MEVGEAIETQEIACLKTVLCVVLGIEGVLGGGRVTIAQVLCRFIPNTKAHGHCSPLNTEIPEGMRRRVWKRESGGWTTFLVVELQGKSRTHTAFTTTHNACFVTDARL